MNAEDKKKYRTQAKVLKSFITVGKKGISENVIENISKNLKANKLTKIKLLKTYVDSVKKDKKELAKNISEKTNSEIIDVIGQVIVLYKR